MPKISKEFRRSVDERGPTDREARGDLERVVRRVERRRRTSARFASPLFAVAALATIASLYWMRREKPLVIEVPAPTLEPSGQSVTSQRPDVVAYLRKSDEPESTALSFQMTQGDR